MYTIVIPVYKDYENLRNLLNQIMEANYSPTEILIIDDGSRRDDMKYLGSVYSTNDTKVKVFRLDKHSGPYYAEVAGLDLVKTEYAVVLHSDTSIQGDLRVEHSDVLNVLLSYIDQTDEATAMSCFGVDINNPRIISKSPRVLGDDKIPYSQYLMYDFPSLVPALKWREVLSFDSGCYVLRMSTYEKLGYREKYAPYKLYFDDFLARAREEEARAFYTTDTVYYHPYSYQQKPKASLAVVPENWSEVANKWTEEWSSSSLWQSSSLHYQLTRIGNARELF